MEIGMIGLGRMGGNMAQRLLKGGHSVVAYDPNEDAVKAAEHNGAKGANSIADLVSKLSAPRAAWVMVPSGDPTEITINTVADAMSPGDVIIDGGNSNYKDSVRRASALKGKGISFLDAGTSGGIWGLTEGYSMMVGGDTVAFQKIKPIIQTLAPGEDFGYGHVGPAGAGHFVKMVLQHVAHHARLVVVTAPVSHEHLFRDANLNVIDVVPVPDRFEDGVCKSEDQDVLHGLFAKVVVDSINLTFTKDLVNHIVEGTSGGKVSSERFLDYNPTPAFLLERKARGSKSLDSRLVKLRGNRQVE